MEQMRKAWIKMRQQLRKMKEVEVEDREVKRVFDQLKSIHLKENRQLMKLKRMMMDRWIQEDRKMELDSINH
jgi:hypothetical protein